MLATAIQCMYLLYPLAYIASLKVNISRGTFICKCMPLHTNVPVRMLASGRREVDNSLSIVSRKIIERE